MTEHVKAWQCIGCGKIEAPQNCIGICQDRRVELVYAFDHEEALVQLSVARKQVEVLCATLRQLVATTPREGEWERSYLALQNSARRALATIVGDSSERGIATAGAVPRPVAK